MIKKLIKYIRDIKKNTLKIRSSMPFAGQGYENIMPSKTKHHIFLLQTEFACETGKTHALIFFFARRKWALGGGQGDFQD